MKLAIVLVAMSLAVMAAVVFQAGRQELTLRALKFSFTENAAKVAETERAIKEVKTKISENKKSLEGLTAKIEEHKKKKEEQEKTLKELEGNLQTCNKEKARHT